MSDTTVDDHGAVTITSEATGTEWEIVVGLEVHCELATATKAFC